MLKKIENYLKPYNDKLNALLHLKRIKQNPFITILPEFIQEILLNMTCDMTIEKAVRVAISGNQSNPLYEELNQLQHKHASSVYAVNRFAVVCNHNDLWKLSRLINQNFLTGSEMTYMALEKFHEELWQKKLQAVKMKSEKVSVYLTFLLMLSLISIIIVVIAPIMININH